MSRHDLTDEQWPVIDPQISKRQLEQAVAYAQQENEGDRPGKSTGNNP